MPSCPSCGKSVADGAAFCGYCGAGTTAPAASDSPGDAVQRSDADYWICGSCHAENLVGDAFCQTCGLPRASVRPSIAPPHVAAPAAVPAAGMDVVAHGLVCTSCGTANEPDASFCHVCGVPLVAKTVSHSSQPAWGTPSPAPKAPPSSSRWIVLVAVIVAVAAAVVIGIVVLGGQGGGGAGASAETTATADEATSGPSEGTSESSNTSFTPSEREVTGDVTGARASSCLNQIGSIDYVAWNLLDGDMETCWSEGIDGDYGIGETVRFKFAQRMTLTRMEVMPGYNKYDEGDDVDRWSSNGRLREITVTFADGTQDSYSFSDSKKWQPCDFGEKTGSTLEFTIESVYDADSGTEHDADDTSVSEVRFYGWPASEGGE